MSIEKIYSSFEMTKFELGKYVPEIEEENLVLAKKVNDYQLHMDICGGVMVVSGLFIGGLLLSMLGANFSAQRMLALACVPPAAVALGSCFAMDFCEIDVRQAKNEMAKSQIEKADRSVDLQNEANRLWVKREQIQAMQDNNNARYEFDKKLAMIDETFGIRPNVNSEEEYLAYWANANKIT